MQDKWICPVCGWENEDNSLLICRDCRAQIHSEDIEVAKDTFGITVSPYENNGFVSKYEDELIRLFRKRFEEYQIESPVSWHNRLCFLASNAEPSRRYATIVFVDLCKYTLMTHNLTEDQHKEILQWYYSMVTRVIEFYGGFVISFIGDAVLAAFGAPSSFERDAESAVQAMLAIRKEVERKKHFYGEPLAIRGGAACGSVQVVINEVHGGKRVDLLGPAVTLASRLETTAKPMELIISDRLANQVRHAFVLESRDPFAPKNFKREVYPYVVLHQLTTDPFSRRSHQYNMVGRDEEIQMLQKHWKKALKGKPTAICISGEVGVGKSKLLKAFIDKIEEKDVWSVVYDCQPSNRHSLLEVMRHLLKIIIYEDGKDKSHINGFTSELEPVLRASIGYVLQEPEHVRNFRDIPGKVLKQQIIDAFSSLFCKLARKKPVLISIDDAQWIDVFSWNVIDSLAKSKIPGLHFIIAGRSIHDSKEKKEAPYIRACIDNLRLSNDLWEDISLKPLEKCYLQDILEEIFSREKIHPSVLARVLEESSGIPLYLVELGLLLCERNKTDYLAKMLIDNGDDDLSNVVIEVLQNQLDELTVSRRNILQVSSVLGKKFSYQLLRQFDVLHIDLLAELYALKGMRFLFEEIQPDDIYFSFNPSMLRNAAYQMLTESQRVELHSLAARKIEEYLREHPGDFLYEIAFHWLKAGSFSKARLYLKKAANRALNMGMPGEALELTMMGLNLLESSSKQSLDTDNRLGLQQEAILRDLAGRALYMIGDYRLSNEYFQKMRDLAILLSNKHWEAMACKGLALNALEQGKTPLAVKIFEDVRVIYSGDPPPHMMNLRGIIELRSGQYDKAAKTFQSLVDHTAKKKSVIITLADACNNLGLTYWQQGKYQPAEDAFNKGLEIWRAEKNIFGQASTLNNLGILAEKSGKYSRALRFYNEAIILCEEIGYVLGLSAIYSNMSNLYLLMDNPVQAEYEAVQSLSYAEMISHTYSESVARENLGLSCCAQGKFKEGQKHLEKALKLAKKVENKERSGSASLALAWLHMRVEEFPRAYEYLNQSENEIQPDLKEWKRLLLTALQTHENKNSALMKPYLKDLSKSESYEQRIRVLWVLDWLDEKGVHMARS